MSARHISGRLASRIASLLLCATLDAQSPTSALTIHVTDPAGAPIEGARVAAAPRTARVPIARETDRAGTARFDDLRPGAYVIEILAAGFAPAARSIALRSDPARVTVSLDLAAVTEHVLVTSTGHLETTAEVSKALTVVDAREIAARQEFSVAGALRSVPGLTVQQLGGPGSFTSVRVRGLRQQDTSFLIDGVRFRDAASPQGDATAFISDLHIANIDRIEVLRGSASSLYGSHATGGVVNLITASGSGRPAGEVRAEVGGLGFTRVTAQAGGGAASDRVTFSVGAGHTRTLRGIDGDDDARNTSVHGRGDVRIGTAARATLRVYGSDAAASLNESPAAIGPLPAAGFVRATPATFSPAANDPDGVRASDFLSTLLLIEHRPSQAFGYTASLHRLTTNRVFRDGPLGVSAFEPPTMTSSRSTGAIDTLDIRADRDWGSRQTTRVAYEFEREHYVSKTVPVDRSLAWEADVIQTSHAASVQHEVRLDLLQVAGSLRAQRFELHDVGLTPVERAPFTAAEFTTPPAALTADIAAARSLSATGTKLRAHIGNAYRAPAMFERTGVFFGSGGYTIFGDPRLEPERSISVDAGVDQMMAGGRVLISATWFQTRLTRVISFQSLDSGVDPFGRSSGYRTADGRTTRGVEISARLHPRRATEISLAYTGADAPPPAGDRDGLPRAAAISTHQFSAWITQRAGALDLSFELEAAGDHFATLFDPIGFGSRAYRFSAFAKADVAVSYRPPVRPTGVSLFGVVENVFDRSYFVQGFRGAGRVGRAGLRVKW